MCEPEYDNMTLGLGASERGGFHSGYAECIYPCLMKEVK